MKFREGKGDLVDRKVIAQGSVQIVPDTLAKKMLLCMWCLKEDL